MKLKSWITVLLINKIDWTTFKTWSSKQMKRWINSSLRWTGIRKNLSSGPLLRDRKKRITLLLKNTEEQMRLRLKNLLFKLKNWLLKLLEKPKNLKKKLLRLKLLKLSLIKPLKNLKDCTLRDISFIFNGKKLLKTLEREMNLSMRLVRIMQEPKTTLIRRSLTWMIIRQSWRESKRII